MTEQDKPDETQINTPKPAHGTSEPMAKTSSGNAGQGKVKKPGSRPLKSNGEKSKFLRVFTVLILLAILGLLAGGGYWVYQNKALFGNDYSANLAEQRVLIDALQQGIEREREQRAAAILEQQNALVSLESKLSAQQQALKGMGRKDPADWLLDEAAYLLRLGNQRLAIEKVPDNALQLFESADEILRDIDRAELYPVRKAIAADITSLKLVGKIDREGLYLQLDAISENISRLSMEPLRMSLPVAEDATENIDLTGWQRLLHNFKDAASRLFKAVFRVQYHERPVEPLMTLEQQQTVRITLSMVLEQAKVALLSQQQAVFDHSLGKAQTMLSENFSRSEELDAVIAMLEELKQRTIVQTLPDGTDSLRALRQYIDTSRNSEPDGRVEAEQ